MVNFTINNLSGGSVTYQGVTIASENSFVVSTMQTDFATDGFLLADLAIGIISITINNKTLLGPPAVQLLIQLTLISFSGITGVPAPQRAMFLGADDGTGNLIGIKASSSGELSVKSSYLYSHIIGNTTTVVKSGAGVFHSMTINRNWTGGTIVIYDNIAGSGTKIATYDVGTPSGGLLSTSGIPSPQLIGPLGLEFTTGLTVVTSGSNNNDITILYR